MAPQPIPPKPSEYFETEKNTYYDQKHILVSDPLTQLIISVADI